MGDPSVRPSGCSSARGGLSISRQCALEAQAQARQAEIDNDLTARIDALREQTRTASEARKAQTEQRVAEVKADYQERRAKLEQASKLIKEALGPKQPA